MICRLMLNLKQGAKTRNGLEGLSSEQQELSTGTAFEFDAIRSKSQGDVECEVAGARTGAGEYEMASWNEEVGPENNGTGSGTRTGAGSRNRSRSGEVHWSQTGIWEGKRTNDSERGQSATTSGSSAPL